MPETYTLSIFQYAWMRNHQITHNLYQLKYTSRMVEFLATSTTRNTHKLKETLAKWRTTISRQHWWHTSWMHTKSMYWWVTSQEYLKHYILSDNVQNVRICSRITIVETYQLCGWEANRSSKLWNNLNLKYLTSCRSTMIFRKEALINVKKDLHSNKIENWKYVWVFWLHKKIYPHLLIVQWW